MANPTYDVHANDAASEASVAQFNIDRTHPGQWTISFNNPPINMFVPSTIVELGALMTDLEADPSVKVVVFQSANSDFFIAHLDVGKAAERPEVLGLWRDFVLRTRGIGNEFVLALRHALRQPAKRPVRQPRGRRRTGPGRRSAGMAPALGRSLTSA